MLKQKQAGLLSGLWSFIEIPCSDECDQMNERKRKCFVIEEAQRMALFDSTMSIEQIKLAGQVTLILLTCSHSLTFFRILVSASLLSHRQTVHHLLRTLRSTGTTPESISHALAERRTSAILGDFDRDEKSWASIRSGISRARCLSLSLQVFNVALPEIKLRASNGKMVNLLSFVRNVFSVLTSFAYSCRLGWNPGDLFPEEEEEDFLISIARLTHALFVNSLTSLFFLSGLFLYFYLLRFIILLAITWTWLFRDETFLIKIFSWN